MKRFLLILTLLVSLTGFSQIKSTLRFTNTSTFDELINSFDNPRSESGYFEFWIDQDRKMTAMHYHDNNGIDCYTSSSINLNRTASHEIDGFIYDVYKATDEKGNEFTFTIFMNTQYSKFNIIVSNKDTRSKVFIIDTFEVDYKGRTKIRKLDKWYINKTIYEINNIINE